MVGCVSGCVGMAGCHTLLHLCKFVLSVGDPSLQEASVRSVRSVGIQFAHGIHRTHRWLVALVVAWVRQDAIPSYICVNPCYLWETLLCKKLLWVPCVLWEYSSPTDCTDQHRWLVALVRPRNPQNSQKFGCVSGCVGMAGCHTLLHLCKSVLSVGDPSLQEASVRSVGSVGVPLLAWLVQQRLLHPLRLHQCHLWKSLLCKKFLCVLWVLWEAISRMWLRGYGRMPYPPILWGARCPVSSDRCRVRRCRSYPRYNR